MDEQIQQPLKDQIQELCVLGEKTGLHAAVDFVQDFIRKQEAIDKKHEKCVKK
jgi:hypothetical protein